MLVKMSKDGKTEVAISKGKLPDGTALAVTEVWHKTYRKTVPLHGALNN
jgi:hypothetical protein